ncbi:TPA: phage holin [Streptococcus suis]|nr:phage holin [Streptococcus suis]
MNINWKVRFKNKTFWIAIIPAIALVVQQLAQLFGFELDTTETVQGLLDLANALFAVLAIIGIVADPTTVGIEDSVQALTYRKPKDDKEG